MKKRSCLTFYPNYLIKVKQNVDFLSIGYPSSIFSMSDSDLFDSERLDKIIIEVKLRREQQLDGQPDEGLSTYLKKNLSPEDFRFWQVIQRPPDDPSEEYETTRRRTVDYSRDEFKQLCGRYKRAGYELIANSYQQESKC